MLSNDFINYWFNQTHHRDANPGELSRFMTFDFGSFIKAIVYGSPFHTLPFAWPVGGRRILNVGYHVPQYKKQFGFEHEGWDINTHNNGHQYGFGEPILAADMGLVEKAEFDPRARRNGKGYGNYIILRHNNGTRTLYGHLSKVNVIQGWYVARGQKIGESGDTGFATGPHLHFEVRVQQPVLKYWYAADPHVYLGNPDIKGQWT